MRKILVVDDNDAITDMIVMMLGTTYEVSKSNDGMEGMRLAAQLKPDLILLDVMMPRLSGLEMLRQLQAGEATRSIPVIMMTAVQFDPDTQAALRREPNVASFLRKPCSVNELCGQVEAALARPRP